MPVTLRCARLLPRKAGMAASFDTTRREQGAAAAVVRPWRCILAKILWGNVRRKADRLDFTGDRSCG